MEGRDHQVALAGGHAVARHAREHLHAGPGLLDPRRPDEHRVHGLRAQRRHVHARLEARPLAAERVAAHDDVHPAHQRLRAPGGRARQHDHAGAGAERRHALVQPLAQRAEQPGALGHEAQRGALAPGKHDGVEPLELGGAPHLDGLGARGRQRPLVLGEGALHREHPHPRPAQAARRHAHHPLPCSRSPCASAEISMPAMASFRPDETRARTSGSSKWVTASTMARARRGGSSLL